MSSMYNTIYRFIDTRIDYQNEYFPSLQEDDSHLLYCIIVPSFHPLMDAWTGNIFMRITWSPCSPHDNRFLLERMNLWQQLLHKSKGRGFMESGVIWRMITWLILKFACQNCLYNVVTMTGLVNSLFSWSGKSRQTRLRPSIRFIYVCVYGCT